MLRIRVPMHSWDDEDDDDDDDDDDDGGSEDEEGRLQADVLAVLGAQESLKSGVCVGQQLPHPPPHKTLCLPSRDY